MAKKMEDRDISLNELPHIMGAYPEIDWKKMVSDIIKRHKLIKKIESDPLRYYAYKRWAEEEGKEAHELFKF